MNSPDSTLSRPAQGFASDNNAGASVAILEAMQACNAGQYASYGADALSARVQQRFCKLFEREVEVFLVPTGTVANALSLAVLTPPWGNMYCHPLAHINHDECGAPEFYTAGAHLICVEGEEARINPDLLRVAVRTGAGDVHSTQPSAVSVTQATEIGTVYSVEQVATIGDICRTNRLRLHMDGARFANAVAALGCTPADLTWRAGVDVLSFGATKNGAAGVEAIVLFDASLSQEMAFRRKRAGHLFSKMRFLSAQMDSYLNDGLWLANATQANAMAHRLVEGLATLPGVSVIGSPRANIIFCHLPEALRDGLLAAGFDFYHGRWEPGVVRFVTSFATTRADVDNLLAHACRLCETHGL